MTADIHWPMSYSAVSFQSLFQDRPQLQQNLHLMQVETPDAVRTKVILNTNSGDRYIVVLREGSTNSDRLELIEELKKYKPLYRDGSRLINDLYDNVFVGFSISIPTEIIRAIQDNPRVEIVERDQRVQIFAQILPTGVNRVDGDLSSTEFGNGQGAVDTDIAILDTCVDLNHPDLNVYRERTFVTGTSSADDDQGHGTHVAGIAPAKDNSIGVVVIASGARLWAVKVLDSTGSGFISEIIAG